MARKHVTDEMVVAAYHEIKNAERAGTKRMGVLWPYQVLSIKTGEHEKVCYRACERAQDHGLIECGVSLRSGWLTAEGVKLLESATETA